MTSERDDALDPSEQAPESAPAAPDNEPATQWGRIDDSGGVYVTTTDGERLIGSWQAGDATEGLAFYERQYADLAVTIDLLQQRVTRGLIEPSEARKKLTALRSDVATAAVIGDLQALDIKLDAVDLATHAALRQREAQRAEAKSAALARKTALVEEAEALSTSSSWKSSGDRLREIVEEFKLVKGVDRAADQELWKRYQAAREEFSRRRGAHFATLDEQRRETVAYKEALIAEAQTLSSSEDWKGTADRLKALMADWKGQPRAGREVENELWARFRAAHDVFFNNRAKAFGERDAEFRENQAAKIRLLEAAEAVDPATDLERAKDSLRHVKAEWDRIGKVPREAIGPLDTRLRALDDRVRGAQDAAWQTARRASNPLAAQFREQIERLEQQAAKARAAGRISEAERAESAAATWRASLDEAEKRS